MTKISSETLKKIEPLHCPHCRQKSKMDISKGNSEELYFVICGSCRSKYNVNFKTGKVTKPKGRNVDDLLKKE